jgi:hypothetical protein
MEPYNCNRRQQYDSLVLPKHKRFTHGAILREQHIVNFWGTIAFGQGVEITL